MPRSLATSALLVVLLAFAAPQQCLGEAQSASQPGLHLAGADSSPEGSALSRHGRALLQDLLQEADSRVEEAILDTWANPDEEQQQQQPGRQVAQEQQQARRQQAQTPDERRRLNGDGADGLGDHAEGQRQKEAQAEEHTRLLESQRKEAVQSSKRAAAARDADRQEQSLGRGSLRGRKQPATKPPVVSGSRKNDMFAQQTERQLAAAQERRQAAQRARQRQQQQQGQQQRKQAQPVEGGSTAAASGAAAGTVGAAGERQRQPIPLLLIVFMTIAMAAAGGLGALPFFFVKTMSDSATGVATAVACGVMLAASFDLVHDGQPYGGGLVVLGLLLGGAFIRWVQQHLEEYEDIEFGALQGSAARKTVLMVGIMAAHALGEGCAVGVSFCGDRGWAQGLLTTLAIGVHNIPEGLAKATVLVGQGVSANRALLWSIVTCLPQPLVAIPSFMFVDAFTMILPVALGFAAGCMIWMVFAELLPDALERGEASSVATAATVSAAFLEGFRMLFASMEQEDGSFGGSAAASAAGGVAWRMGPPLLVLLPGVVACGVGGGALGGSAVPAPVAWGLAAAAAASMGSGSIVDQLVWRPQVPMVHTAAAAAAGATLAVLLHKQLLAWASTSAAALAARLLAKSTPGTVGIGIGGGANGKNAPDVEALEYASMYQQHHLHHHPPHKHHHHSHPLPHPQAHHAPLAPAGPPLPHDATYMDGAGAGINGFGGSTSSLQYQAPYHRGSSSGLPGSSQLGSGACTPTSNGAVTPVQRRWRGAGMLPAPQLAAALATLAALAAGAVAAGWHMACSLLLMGEYRSAALLPAAALLLAGPGLGAGALARTLPGRAGSAAGAWAGALLALLAAIAAALTAARAYESAHTATLVRSLMYPYGFTDTAEALTGGALCAAAVFCFQAGAALKPSSTRGGVLLGATTTLLLAALRYALCSFTPYCLSVQLLLAGRQ